MAATTEPRQSGTGATPRLDVDAICERLADKLGIAKEDVSDQMLADQLGGDRSLWWRYRTQGVRPSFGRLLELATVLELSVEALTKTGEQA